MLSREDRVSLGAVREVMMAVGDQMASFFWPEDKTGSRGRNIFCEMTQFGGPACLSCVISRDKAV